MRTRKQIEYELIDIEAEMNELGLDYPVGWAVLFVLDHYFDLKVALTDTVIRQELDNLVTWIKHGDPEKEVEDYGGHA